MSRIEQLCPRAIGEHEPVRRRAVVIRSRETLIMQSARSARRDNHRLCAGNENFLRFHIQEHGTGNLSVRILDKLDCGSKIHYRDAAI